MQFKRVLQFSLLLLLTVLNLVFPQVSFAKDQPILKLGSSGLYVELLQKDITCLSGNFNNFGINGYFGVKTEQAVGNYQDEYHIPRDGVVGYTTWKVLTDNVKAVQNRLNVLGYTAGTPDGWFGKQTELALKQFQKSQGLYPEGIVNPRTRRKLFNPYPKDNYPYQPTSNSVNSLNPYVARLARKFLDLAKANKLDVRIITAYRNWNEQDKLYAQGRTTPGDIVTNTRGGESFHNWGLAFDAAPYVNGVISNNSWLYQKMGKLGVEVGLEWGGNFKDIVDLPHFQYTFGLNVEDFLNGVSPSK